MPKTSAILVLKDIRLAPQDRHDAETAPINLEITPGESVVVTGPSGSGKSSLLFIAAGFQRPHPGAVMLFGSETYAARVTDSFPIRRRIGFVFQEPVFVSHLSCLENIELPLYYDGKLDEDAIREKAAQTLALAGLEKCPESMPDDHPPLVRRKLALARAWMRDPEIVFYDEPAKLLDALAQKASYRVIRDYHEHRKKTGRPASAFISCNDPRGLLDWADHFLALSDGTLTFSADKTTIQTQRLRIERDFSAQ